MSDGFDEVPAAADAQAVVETPAQEQPAPVEVPPVHTHESVLRRLMDRLEAIGQGLDSELSHWMQKAREIL